MSCDQNVIFQGCIVTSGTHDRMRVLNLGTAAEYPHDWKLSIECLSPGDGTYSRGQKDIVSAENYWRVSDVHWLYSPLSYSAHDVHEYAKSLGLYKPLIELRQHATDYETRNVWRLIDGEFDGIGPHLVKTE